MTEPAMTAPAAPDTAWPASPGAADATRRACPWCSAILPAGEVVICPGCHANLAPAADQHLPGLTEVEAPAAARARKSPEPRKRRGLISWISGAIDDAPDVITFAPPDALALPSKDVRREILRLTLEAEGTRVSAGTPEAEPLQDNVRRAS